MRPHAFLSLHSHVVCVVEQVWLFDSMYVWMRCMCGCGINFKRNRFLCDCGRLLLAPSFDILCLCMVDRRRKKLVCVKKMKFLAIFA
jgi:hypothetical protein